MTGDQQDLPEEAAGEVGPAPSRRRPDGDGGWRRQALSPLQLRAAAVLVATLAGVLFMAAPVPALQGPLVLAAAFLWVLPSLEARGTFDAFRARVQRFQGNQPREEETSP